MTQDTLNDLSRIRIERRIPSPEEHRHLAELVGWGQGFNWSALPGSLDASLGGVVAFVDDHIAGMGRLVGDGYMYFYIQDVVVDPAYQRRGIGQRIIDALLGLVRETAPGPVFVGLFATDAALPLYERNGFSEGDMRGMFRIVTTTK